MAKGKDAFAADEELEVLDDLEHKYGKKAFEMEGQPFTLYPLQKKTFEKLASSDVFQTIQKAKCYISFFGILRSQDRADVAKERAEYLGQRI